MKPKPTVLTERDYDIAESLFKYRFLAVSQLQRLHFPSLQTAYRRSRQLRLAGILKTFTVPGISEAICTLDKQGLGLVAIKTGVDARDLSSSLGSPQPKDYYFMKHFLAITDFRILLNESCRKVDVELLGFIPDYYAEVSGRQVARKYIRDIVSDIRTGQGSVAHIPDAVFALRKGGKNALFFLEVDRGTEVVSNDARGVLKAILFYNAYLAEGKYQRYACDFGVEEFRAFRVLFVTTNEKRIEQIRKAAESLQTPAKTKQFVWLSTFDQVAGSVLTSDSWQSADLNDSRRYAIIPS